MVLHSLNQIKWFYNNNKPYLASRPRCSWALWNLQHIHNGINPNNMLNLRGTDSSLHSAWSSWKWNHNRRPWSGSVSRRGTRWWSTSTTRSTPHWALRHIWSPKRQTTAESESRFPFLFNLNKYSQKFTNILLTHPVSVHEQSRSGGKEAEQPDQSDHGSDHFSTPV